MLPSTWRGGNWTIALFIVTCIVAVPTKIYGYSLIVQSSAVTYQVAGNLRALLVLVAYYASWNAPLEPKHVVGILLVLASGCGYLIFGGVGEGKVLEDGKGFVPLATQPDEEAKCNCKGHGHMRRAIIRILAIALVVLVITFGAVGSYTITRRSPQPTPSISLNATVPFADLEQFDNQVLFAIKSPVHGFSRRDIIRRTWVADTQQYHAIDHLFYVSHPELEYADALTKENDQFGDIIVLDHLKENKEIGTSVKTTEMWRHLANEYAAGNGKSYQWMCHVDDDSYVNIAAIMYKYLSRDSAQFWGIHPIKRTVISRIMSSEYPYPGGQMYCLTWDLFLMTAEYLPRVVVGYATDGSFWWHDDAMAGEAFFRTGVSEQITWVPLPNREAFDISESNDLDAWAHWVSKESLNPHKMKTDEEYAAVAAMFDVRKPGGWNGPDWEMDRAIGVVGNTFV
ncbi:hypothetical protein HDV00_010146 [Rhizophlyctis rosea]|nr:hypothetical protein HDV00_010146 [Rhizophlyctis rosea]